MTGENVDDDPWEDKPRNREMPSLGELLGVPIIDNWSDPSDLSQPFGAKRMLGVGLIPLQEIDEPDIREQLACHVRRGLGAGSIDSDANAFGGVFSWPDDI